MKKFMLLAFAVAAAGLTAAPRPSYTEDDFRRITAMTARVLERNHYSGAKMSREFSARIFDNYVDALDPERLLLSEEDLKPFREQRPRLGFQLKEGEYKVAFSIYAIYKVRFDEFRKFSRKFLSAPIDFSVQESYTFDRSKTPRPKTVKELPGIWAIRNAVSCELEFFVHGALCVCYSGQCYLSEKIAGRSANRGSCIQACRSRYDLVDADGKVLVRDKALLSLKDFNLRSRIAELAEAGITSFKIEGRLKNESYVRNVVRDYSIALDELVARCPETYERGSYGQVSGGFTPDTAKTFNRGYTELYIDGKRGKWASMDAAKSMGEEIGQVVSLNKDKSSVGLKLVRKDIVLNNGDGFSFVGKDSSVNGFRGDVCSGNSIRCKSTPSLYVGAKIFRNINIAFEKEIERKACTREIRAVVSMDFIKSAEGIWTVKATALSEDGRKVCEAFEAGDQTAGNHGRMLEMIRSQIGKSSNGYRFSANDLSDIGELPFMSASALNGIRRKLAELFDLMPCGKKDILLRDPEKVTQKAIPQKDVTYKANVANKIAEDVYIKAGASSVRPAYEISHVRSAELMRTRYCIRYELGMCPKYHGAKTGKSLFLLNNGQRFALHFDCRNCEMTVSEA